MTFIVLSLVLFSALMHACWNLFLKQSEDRLVTMATIHLVSGAVGMAAVPFLPLPCVESWPYIFASVVLHLGYQLFLVKAYVYGDLGLVYPIARGISPLLLGFITVFWIGEELTLQMMSAIGLISLGIFSLMFPGKMSIKYTFRPIFYALATGSFIAAYTLADGVGVRASGNAASYVLWLMALECLPLLGITLILRKRAVFSSIHKNWKYAVPGGFLSLSAYWIVIWAMQHAPIALVSAIRESSVVIAALMSIWVLKEETTVKHLLSAVMVAAGVILTRL
jgi:drug/metabolite transporter (DMT)-like permease